MAKPKAQHPAPQAAAGALGGVVLQPVPFDRPWEWLAAGWRDLWRKPEIGLLYGLAAVALGGLLSAALWRAGLEAAIPVAAGGFTLIGPLLAAGLYETSRRLALGEPVTLGATVRAALRSAGRLGLFAACLLIIYLVWIRIAFLLTMLFLGTSAVPPAREFMSMLLFTPHGLGLLVVGTAVGAGLAALVFAISAISVPMLMERRVDAFTAMVTSVRAVLENPKPMLLWAALIAGFVALGLVTLGAGLIVAFPLLGHATWHAYKDAVA